MNASDSAAVRARLLERREALLRGQRAHLELAGTRDTSPDAVDQAAGEAELALAVSAAHFEAEEMDDIDEALRRLEEGVYGTCADCEEAIPPARLEALPYALRCVACQEAHERTGGPTGAAWRDPV